MILYRPIKTSDVRLDERRTDVAYMRRLLIGFSIASVFGVCFCASFFLCLKAIDRDYAAFLLAVATTVVVIAMTVNVYEDYRNAVNALYLEYLRG